MNNEADTIEVSEALTPEQVAAARTLFREYAEDLGWDLSSDGARFAEEIEQLPGPYAGPEGSLLLARLGGEYAGALGLQPVPVGARVPGIGAECFGELKRLFVRPRFRRFGIAKALLARAADEARSRGYSSLVLTTSAEMFPLAQGLYESLGYAVTEPYRDDLPWPHIRWMKLDL